MRACRNLMLMGLMLLAIGCARQPAETFGRTKELLRSGYGAQSSQEFFGWYYLAAIEGDRELLGLLRQNNIDINVRDCDAGQTPLHLAVVHGLKDAVGLLIEHGADVDALTSTGATPLHDAVSLDDAAMARVLLKAGANPNILDTQYHLAPLHISATGDRIDITELLLRHKADPDIRNAGGATPLHLAVSQGLEDQVRALLKAGADPQAKTGLGTSVIDVARDRNDERLLRLLQNP